MRTICVYDCLCHIISEEGSNCPVFLLFPPLVIQQKQVTTANDGYLLGVVVTPFLAC